MTKEVLFGKESRAKTLAGVQAITNAVKVTMGAAGKCVLVGDAVYGNDGMVHLPTIVTKDGWTVTKHFQLSDAFEHRGAMLIKEAATKTVEEVGDSTTCTCVLAEALVTKGMKYIDEGANSQELKRGMDKALEYVIAELKKISTPVRGDIDRVRQIATVSSNNDVEIGNLIANAFTKIGDDGVIDIEASNGTETSIKISDGFKFDRGWVSPLFVNNKAKETCEFENPLVLLYDKKITHHTQIQKAVEISNQQSRPLVIICEDADDTGLSFLAINTFRQNMRVCVVKSPDFGTQRQEMMQDISLLTGGDYVSDLQGIDIKEVVYENFGSAKKIIVSKNDTVIIGGGKDEKKFSDFIVELRMNLAQAKIENEKYPIEKRIARLNGSVAVIQVGAATETELNEKMDRVDDAVRSTRAAIAEGFVAGGGTAFLRIPLPIVKEKNDSGIMKGWNLVFDALNTPLKQICENAGVNGEQIYDNLKKETGNVGYNVLSGEIEDMVSSGIIDSTKALRCALINAVSVAGMILTSECSIITVS